jgi:hypothetical protein
VVDGTVAAVTGQCRREGSSQAADDAGDLHLSFSVPDSRLGRVGAVRAKMRERSGTGNTPGDLVKAWEGASFYHINARPCSAEVSLQGWHQSAQAAVVPWDERLHGSTQFA